MGKKLLLKQLQHQKSSINDYSCDNDDILQPSVSEQSDDISITETKLPGCNLSSLNELKYHGFDDDSNAPAFYWSEHNVPGSGVRNLTAKAFSLHTEQVSNAEARFSLTISNLLIQLTESQRELFAQCMLHAANSKHPHISIFEHTRVPTSEDDFQKFYLSGPNAIVPNLPHPIPKTTTDGTHSFVGLTDLLANELAKAKTFDKFYFESNVRFLPKDVTTLSTTPSAYKLYLDLKEDDQDQYVLYLWYKEWSDDFDPKNTKASRNQVWSNTFTICHPEGENQGRNSYFMSLSCKGEDHSEIKIQFQKELNALSNDGKMFYHGGLKRIMKVKMGNLLLCVDRPERTSILQVGDHNGTFSTFWGHSCKVDGYLIQFPPEMDENWVRYGLAKLGQISRLPNWQRMLFCAYTTQLLHSTGEVCWNTNDSYFIWFEFVCRNSGQIASRRSWKRSCLGLEYTSKCSRLALLWEPN